MYYIYQFTLGGGCEEYSTYPTESERDAVLADLNANSDGFTWFSSTKD